MEGMERCSRREFFTKCVTAGSVSLAAIPVLSACGQKKVTEAGAMDSKADPVTSCDDLSQVSTRDIALRQKLGYVKESPIADNHCQNCNLYLPPKAGQTCGGCMLFKGPVYPDSYCTYWAPKV